MTNKEAIEILSNYSNGYFGYKIDDVHKAHELAIKALEERPQGEWNDIYESHIAYECSNCKIQMPIIEEYFNYCPNCGADMKGGAE